MVEGRIDVRIGIGVAVDPDLEEPHDFFGGDGLQLALGPLVVRRERAPVNLAHQRAETGMVELRLRLLCLRASADTARGAGR